jgi:hypothetical protein
MTETTRYTVQPTGDDQFEAQVTLVTLKKLSKVFPTHDEAEEWAQELLESEESGDERSEQTSADTTSDEGDTGQSQS